MKNFARSVTTALALSVILAAPTFAQDPPQQGQVRVFIDCSHYCDMDFLRTELTWIDHMRDRADAQVHVLVTRQTTGGGGGEFTLEFIGLRDFAGRVDTLKYVGTADDTPDITRRALTRTIKLGLVPFVASTPLGGNLDVSLVTAQRPGGTTTQGTSATPQRDPWNFWTFTTSVNGYSNGESQQKFQNIFGSISANRTTEAWKINLRLNNSYSESSFKYTLSTGEEKTTTSISRSYGASSLIVKSITPHLSVGARGGASSSTFGNNKLSLNLAPAIEYNFVPYSESTRRMITLQYSAGVRYAEYDEITIFDQLEETRPIHNLALNYSTRQPWGSINVGIDGSQYLHDSQKYSAGIGGSTNLRLVRGLSFNIGGNYRHVRDQLSLRKGTLTEEEVLLRQKQLETSFYYFINFGLSYRFGSIFNNVVNPRFGGGGEGMIIMM